LTNILKGDNIMGLDMYLYKETYVQNWSFHTPEQKWNITVTKGGEPSRIRPERICTIIEEIVYWRKFNALHTFIVNNFAGGVDECQKIFLYDYEIDEWYWKDVENAYKVFSEILSDGEETREYYYQASW